MSSISVQEVCQHPSAMHTRSSRSKYVAQGTTERMRSCQQVMGPHAKTLANGVQSLALYNKQAHGFTKFDGKTLVLEYPRCSASSSSKDFSSWCKGMTSSPNQYVTMPSPTPRQTSCRPSKPRTKLPILHYVDNLRSYLLYLSGEQNFSCTVLDH